MTVLFKRMDTLKTSIYGLFRTIKRTCTFPSFWKIGKVKLLFKEGNRALVTNYRPITLLCILSKIFENCIFDSLLFCCPVLTLITVWVYKRKVDNYWINLLFRWNLQERANKRHMRRSLILGFWKSIRQNSSCHSDREVQVNWSLWEVIEYYKKLLEWPKTTCWNQWLWILSVERIKRRASGINSWSHIISHICHGFALWYDVLFSLFRWRFQDALY